MKLTSLIFLMIGIYAVNSAKPSSYKFNMTEGDFTLQWGPDTEFDKFIWMKLTHTNNNGWIALGFGSVQSMTNIDIWKFTWNGQAQQVIATDQRSLGFNQPTNDEQNDLEVDQSESNFENGAWTVVFKRRLFTGDDADARLLCGNNNIAFGLGADMDNTQHKETPKISMINIDDNEFGCSDESSLILQFSLILGLVISLLI